MKKYLSIIIAIIMTASCLCACSSPDLNAAGADDKIQIVTTIFPEYDWVMNVLGENPANAEVTMLLNNGVDLHSYQPTAEDILKISTCDMFIYVGGESDKWVADAVKESVNKDMVVINLMDVLGSAAKEEEVVEGMQACEEDHEHDDDEVEDHEHEHDEDEIEYDEHVWLSLKNAASFVQEISDSLQKIDPQNAETYKNNAASYMAKLEALDKEYSQTIDSASVHTLLFGDRFPFRYLVDDYGLEYYAAFVGCSAETEASFETITFLSKKADELNLPAVLTIDGSDQKIAKTIVENMESKDTPILSLDSMQSITSADIENGATYLTIMEKNLSVLKQALNN